MKSSDIEPKNNETKIINYPINEKRNKEKFL